MTVATCGFNPLDLGFFVPHRGSGHGEPIQLVMRNALWVQPAESKTEVQEGPRPFWGY